MNEVRFVLNVFGVKSLINRRYILIALTFSKVFFSVLHFGSVLFSAIAVIATAAAAIVIAHCVYLLL